MTNAARLTLEVFNLFDSDVSDIDYFYISRLPGEPLGGVDDIHSPVPPAHRTGHTAGLVLTWKRPIRSRLTSW